MEEKEFRPTLKAAISQPMAGKTEEQIMMERRYLVSQLEGLGFEVINTILDVPKVEYNPVLYLGKSIELMAEADVIVFMPGWENARGCVIEHEVARRYQKFIMEVE